MNCDSESREASCSLYFSVSLSSASLGNAIPLTLVPLGPWSESHTPDNIAKALVGTKRIERGIDVQKRPERFSLFIVSLKQFQSLLLFSQSGVHLRHVELSDFGIDFRLFS